MSDATEFLSTWIAKAGVRSPSITRTSVQAWPGVGGPPNYKPGITGYGWGIDGFLVKDAGGAPIGLSFGLDVWFSDRGLDLSNPPPPSGQQFVADASDKEVITLTLSGDQVQLHWQLPTWGGELDAYTSRIDSASQHLLFNVPGAGPNAPEALLLLSLADTGQFGWL